MFLFRRNGRYHVEYFDETRNCIRRISTRATTKAEALKFLSDFKSKLNQSRTPEFITLFGFAEAYIEYVRSRNSKNYFLTVERSMLALRNFAGDVPLKALDLRLLERFFESGYRKSKSTADMYHRTLAAAFNKAVEWNYLSENLIKKIRLPKIPKKLPVFITGPELMLLLEHTVKPDLKDLFILGYHTGLRLSELLNLEWQSVNLTERTIKVSNTETFTTKSKKERVVPMNKTVFNLLEERRPKTLHLQVKNYVFHKHPGLRYEKDFVSKHFKKAVRAAKLNERLHFHSLRHSTASNMVRRGVPIAVVKEVLGHTDIKTTMVYSHVLREDLVDAVMRLE